MKYLSLLILSLLLCCSCGSGELQDLTAVELETMLLRNGFTEEDLSESAVSQLEPDSSFFLAVKAASLGYEKTSLLLSRHSWRNSSGIIREKAAELHVKTAYEMNLWADTEFTASLAASDYPDNYGFRRSALAAAYWQHKDAAVTSGIGELQILPGAEGDWELYLFKAVSSYRIKSSGWEDSWIEMFKAVPSSEFIRRGWDYLSAVEEEPFRFFPGYEQLIEGKYLASTGEYGAAIELLNAWLIRLDEEGASSEGRAVCADLEKLFTIQGWSSKGGAVFKELAAEASDEDEAAARLFAAARLYRKAAWYGNAERCLDSLLESAGEDISDRLLWYSFDIKVKRNPAKAASVLERYSVLWDDPEYFADTLDNLCTALVRQRKWKDIAEVSDILELAGPVEIADRYRFITNRAAGEGLLPAENGETERVYTDLYYRILSGDPLSEFSGCPRIAAELPPDTELSPEEIYISGFIKWGLDDLILDELRKNRAQLSESFLVYCADSAIERQEYLDSIRMMYQYQGILSCSGLSSLYPDVYREEIEYASELNNIPPQLLFALVWKESGFEREIVSRSGAVGLCQLMPSTAEDVAGRMKLKVPDLTNPEENLLTGSWYLNWLNGYVGNNSAAVISYNGGPGRVKRWMREYSDLSQILLYEAVPVPETHQYGKKVLTASVLYGMFYYDIEPAETLGIFFP